MKEIIKTINHPRLVWLDMARKITISPNGDLLVPDGTHLNWAEKYKNENFDEISDLPLVSTHFGIVNTIFNLVCKDVIEDEKFCCNKFS